MLHAPFLLTRVLRQEMGFEGIVMSEGSGIGTLVYLNAAASQKEAGPRIEPPVSVPVAAGHNRAATAADAHLAVRFAVRELGETATRLDVRLTLGETAHQIAVPVVAVGHVHPYGVALVAEPALLVRPDSVQKLELELVKGPVEPAGPVLGDRDQPRVMRR